MSWLRLYTDFVYSRKVGRLPEKMQARLVKLWCLHQAGHLIGASTADLAYELRLPESEVAATLRVLTDAGFLDPDGSPHNWDRRQFASDNTTARTRAHRERSRERSAERSPEQPEERSPERSQPVPGNGQNRTEHNRAEPGDVPSPSPAPETIPYAEVIAHLNAATGRSFEATAKETQELIRARWREGRTLDDFLAVIDSRVRLWRDKPDMVEYLRPSTLFARKHFGEYLAAARSGLPPPATVGEQPSLAEQYALMEAGDE